MARLKQYFETNTDRNGIHKWHHYLEIYEFWFEKFIGEPVVILEIGLFQGGSLKMWRDFFGEKALIYGIDINPDCKQFEDENTKIFIGSQEDTEFLESVKGQMPKADIILDDGGHSMKQQLTTFKVLYNHVKDNGFYIVEDLHTSYWKEYGGGYKNTKSFIEYSKNFVDWINAWNVKSTSLKINDFTKSTFSLHYYPSLLLIQKRKMYPPVSEFKGRIVIKSQFPDPRRFNVLVNFLNSLRSTGKRVRKKLSL